MGSIHAFDETEILKLLSQGDEAAFRKVYDRYWRSVHKTAMRYLQSDHHANDIVQDVFTAFWYRRTEFTQIRNIESYLVVMAQNHTYREFRKWAAETRNNEEYALHLETVTNNVESNVLAQQYEDLLIEAVNMLPPQQRKVFQMARMDGLSHEEIAESLNLSQGTVKNHMVRALRFIRHYLAPHVNACLALLTLLPTYE